MISDERLNQLIEYQNKWCAECELDDTEHLPGDGLWDTHNALIELAHYRRTFAKIEEMLNEGDDMLLAMSFNKASGKFVADFDDCIGGSVQVRYAEADTPFAALSALAESVIREEIERKEPPHHEQ